MSTYVKKINFKLHDSYANQNRVLTKPPYEVTETGWGEFEIVIKIYFQDPNERPVSSVTFFKKTNCILTIKKKNLFKFSGYFLPHTETFPKFTRNCGGKKTSCF
jgi:YEATS domain-containing protein 4